MNNSKHNARAVSAASATTQQSEMGDGTGEADLHVVLVAGVELAGKRGWMSTVTRAQAAAGLPCE